MESELNAAVQRVLIGGWYVLGPEVAAFEQAWAEWCGAQQCVSLANGTDALVLSLRALGVGPGDEVVTVANAGGYTSCATRLLGATPRYADVDAATLTLDPQQLAAQITPRTKAIVVVHLYGRVAAIEQIAALAAEHNVPLVEDCAQAHGARWNGQHVGTFGAIGCFSFYPTKNLGALGDGGAVITNSAELAERVRQLRTYGWSHKYAITLSGGSNSRLDALQAAILQVKLAHLQRQNERRQMIAERYAAGLGDLPLQLPAPAPAGAHVHHLYVVRVAVERRDALQAVLREQGVGTDVHYPIPDHRQPAWAADYRDVQLPVTEAAAQQVLSLPCYPELHDAEIDSVIAAVRRCYTI